MTAQHGDVATGPGWELRLGRFQDVLADVTSCDAVITDPPYLSACAAANGHPFGGGRDAHAADESPMGYAPASASLLDDVVLLAARVCLGWFVAFNDFDGAHHIRASVKPATQQERGAEPAKQEPKKQGELW